MCPFKFLGSVKFENLLKATEDIYETFCAFEPSAGRRLEMFSFSLALHYINLIQLPRKKSETKKRKREK